MEVTPLAPARRISNRPAQHSELRLWSSCPDTLDSVLGGSSQIALSFTHDIRPLFRDSPDVDTMKDFGLDLSSYEDVKAKAAAIFERLKDGTMPCDDPWPKEQVALFEQWMEEGMMP